MTAKTRRLTLGTDELWELKNAAAWVVARVVTVVKGLLEVHALVFAFV